ESVASSTALRSTPVTPEGTQTTTRGCAKRFWCTFWMKWRSICSVTSKSAITPSFRGRIAVIVPGVRPSIRFASTPTACTSPLRFQLAGGTYTVTARGNRKQPIFLEPDDHRFHLWCLDQASMRFEVRFHSWVHMTNHFHAIVTTAEANLSNAMHWANGLYAQV